MDWLKCNNKSNKQLRWNVHTTFMVCNKRIGFDLLARIDMIAALGGIHIKQTGAVMCLSQNYRT